MANNIDKLIINSAYREPTSHWKQSQYREHTLVEGRRPAGYFVQGQGSNEYNDIGKFIELPLVNRIRPRVKAWREAGYTGVTGVTKQLLEHWRDTEARQYPFFWCQLDAIETLIWLVEAPPAERVGIDPIPNDGGAFRRICTKLCTGGGKTAVMAMLIAWSICNKAAYPRDTRFSKNIFIVAPGLTVKSRLQVLLTGGDNNYYNSFAVVPNGLMDKLHQGRVIINNWQALAWDSAESIKKRKSVDKRGPKSDEAYVREVLGDMASSRNILVINDEAHHAWRVNPEIKIKKNDDFDPKEATIWINGLDRINKARGILTCYDFSATPFAPSGKKNNEEALFEWIVSDFGLNDGIESGLVKTPRVVVRDNVIEDSQTLDLFPDMVTYKSRLAHIYSDPSVYENIKGPASPETQLPSLLTNAYHLLGADWLETFKKWKAKDSSAVPPVMISVVNRTETAARIKYMFDQGTRVPIKELCEPEYTLHVDSTTIDKDAKERDKDAAALRQKVDTVGQKSKPGEQIRNIISVQMLSEGWDAKTVTHILGLRAFSSQLLCEQVIGRGLRRTSYDLDKDSELFSPEYVNIFGIPFSFLPHESDDSDDGGGTSDPKYQIEALKERTEYEISFPNVVRIDRIYKPELSINIENIEKLVIPANRYLLSAELAEYVDGKTDLTKCTEIDLTKLQKKLRMQKIIFNTTSEIYANIEKNSKTSGIIDTRWHSKGTKFALFGQVIELVRQYLESGAIEIDHPTNDSLRKIILMLNMGEIVQHLWNFIEIKQTDSLKPVFGSGRRVISTGDMPTWFTSKANSLTEKCHINRCVFDSAWEDSSSYKIQNHPDVKAWVKNDHIGFTVMYTFNGVVHRYIPDFLIRLKNGKILVLEIKGQKTDKSEAKRRALEDWVKAVNGEGEFGEWCCDIVFDVAMVDKIITDWANS